MTLRVKGIDCLRVDGGRSNWSKLDNHWVGGKWLIGRRIYRTGVQPNFRRANQTQGRRRVLDTRGIVGQELIVIHFGDQVI